MSEIQTDHATASTLLDQCLGTTELVDSISTPDQSWLDTPVSARARRPPRPSLFRDGDIILTLESESAVFDGFWHT
ncbi:hypothetical protein ACFQJ7_00840 [Halovenus rubra]|uniref:Uncharacterized protein n=2 Tax=Halovenus rubra TaxID=869890 RepID=A0ABD5X064_9EURY|nr:hypothetical protein [Halovenus rubra]